MKILYTTTSFITLAAFIAPLAEALVARGWDVDAAARDVEGNARCRRAFGKVFDMPWDRVPLANLGFRESAARLARIVAENGYDIVHAHTPIAAFITRYAFRDRTSMERPVIVYTAHGFHFHDGGAALANRLYFALERNAARWTDQLVVINRDDEMAARRFGTIGPERINYMPGIGVDLAHYDRDAVDAEEVDSLRARLEFSPSTVVFCCIAEFTRNKRHVDMIHALDELDRDDVGLVFAGPGDIGAARRLVDELGLSERVRFLGMLEDVRPLVRLSRALILVSDREGLPRSVLEAMSMSTAVIGSTSRGTRDLIDETSGVRVERRDRHGLARAIDRLASDREEADRLGRRGRVKAADYAFPHIVDAHVALYEKASRDRRADEGPIVLPDA